MPRKGIIIGFGNMGRVHYDNCQKLKDVEITAVIDSSDVAVGFAKSVGLSAYKLLDECKEASAADFFVICVPTDEHYKYLEIIIKQYKKPIFVEKPAVRTIEEVRALESLARDYPFPIFVGEVEHYNPRMSEFLKLHEDPSYLKISRMVNLPYFLKGAQPWFLEQKRSGGPALDLMYHDLSCAISIFGTPVLGKVTATQTKYNCVDEVTAQFQFQHFNAEIKASWVSEDTDHPIVTIIEVGKRYGAQPLKIRIDDYLLKDKLLSDDAYYLELEAFIRAIETNKVEHPLGEYLAVVQIANHINDKIQKQQQFASSSNPISAFQIPVQTNRTAHLTLVKSGTPDEDTKMYVVPGRG